MRQEATAQASVRLRPPGTQSGLSRTSTVISPVFGIDRHLGRDRDALVGHARHRIVAHLVAVGAGRQLADRGDGAALAVVHPGLDEVALIVSMPVLRHQLLQPALAGAAGADLGAVVAVPDVADADLLQPDADQVVLVLEVLLDAHAGEMHALLIDGRGDRAGRWTAPARRYRHGASATASRTAARRRRTPARTASGRHGACRRRTGCCSGRRRPP